MSRLPVADYKTMDKLLHRLGFAIVRQNSIVILMAGRQRFPVIAAGILPAH